MSENRAIDIERSIAQCRVMLSVAAFVTVYIDPTRPTLTRWLPPTGGPSSAERVLITIDDDGIAFPAGVTLPWSIASRAAELGGETRLGGRDRPGGHLEIERPEA